MKNVIMKNGKEDESIVINNLIFIAPDDNKWYSLDNLPNEKWKDIDNYEGEYQISNYGRVKSLKRELILKPLKSKHTSYRYYVSLSHKNIVRQVKCHRLVANAFIPNPNNLHEVNHKNPVTEQFCDNRSSNLEWVTHGENMRWRAICNNHPKNTFIKNGEHVCNKKVVQINKDGGYIQTFPSLRKAMEITGIHETNISKVCHKIIKSTGGYKFMFEEDYMQCKISGK